MKFLIFQILILFLITCKTYQNRNYFIRNPNGVGEKILLGEFYQKSFHTNMPYGKISRDLLALELMKVGFEVKVTGDSQTNNLFINEPYSNSLFPKIAQKSAGEAGIVIKLPEYPEPEYIIKLNEIHKFDYLLQGRLYVIKEEFYKEDNTEIIMYITLYDSKGLLVGAISDSMKSEKNEILDNLGKLSKYLVSTLQQGLKR